MHRARQASVRPSGVGVHSERDEFGGDRAGMLGGRDDERTLSVHQTAREKISGRERDRTIVLVELHGVIDTPVRIGVMGRGRVASIAQGRALGKGVFS